MLLVNCSYEPADLIQYIAGNLKLQANVKILDFASTYSKENSFDVIYPADIDNKNYYHHIALNDFVNQMGKLSIAGFSKNSDCSVRSIKFNTLPLYWLTEISEKHPRTSLVKKLYYFKHLFHLLNFKGNEVVFVLPGDSTHFISAIREYVHNKINKAIKVTFNVQEPVKLSLNAQLKLTLDFFKKIRIIKNYIRKGIETKKQVDIKQTDNVIFTYYPETWRDDINGDYVLHKIENYSSGVNHKTLYALFLFEYYSLKEIQIRDKWDLNYFKAFPSLVQILKFNYGLLSAHSSITKFKLKSNEFDFVNTDVLYFELMAVITRKREYLFNHIWLSNYFKIFKNPVKVFYQDEFYASGRVISAAAKKSENNHIQTYGVQHGIFYEAHTVYSLTDDELNNSANNGLPIPDKFVVWGEYFKRHFLKYNTKGDDFVISAGNPGYTAMPETVYSSHKKHNLNILWCTTNKIDIINQYKNIISGFLDNYNDAFVTVRCHPQLDFKSFIGSQLLKPDHVKRVKFSLENSIYEAINTSDIVLSSSGSTVFLDAMVCKKPVFKLVNDDYYMGDLGDKEMPKVYSHQDLINEIQRITSDNNATINYSDLLNTNPSQWKKLFEYNAN